MTPVPALIPSKPLAPARRAASRGAGEADLVDRIFELLAAELADIAADQLEALKATARSEFGGQVAWVNRRDNAKRQELADRVLRLFNGRNASEIARELGIGRATVYRILKQHGKG